METLHMMAHNISIFCNMQKDWTIHGRLLWFSGLIAVETVYIIFAATSKKR